jgi:putative ABC transport system permease protein
MPAAVPLARRNLFADRARFAMSVAGVAFSVMLVLVILSLYRGWSKVGGLFQELPGDLWVTQAGTSDPLHSMSFLPAGDAGALTGAPGVALVMPVVSRHVVLHRGLRTVDALVMGIGPPAGLDAAARQQFFPATGTIVISAVAADGLGAGVGDTVRVVDRALVVARIRPGGNPITEVAFVSLTDSSALVRLPGTVTFFLLRSRPGHAAAVAAAVRSLVPDAEVHTSAEFSEAFSQRVTKGFLPVVQVLVGIGLVVGAGVIALTTYTATIERARDFGVLKAIGAADGFLYRVVVEQSVLVGSAGAALGVAVSAIAARVIPDRVPEFVTDLRPADVALVFAAALVAALVAASVPTYRISRIDPAVVFRA